MNYNEKTNKELKEICEERNIEVDSKNVSKPTKKEFLTAIEKDDASADSFLTDNAIEIVEKVEEKTETKVDVKEAKKKELTKSEMKRMQFNELMAMKRVIVTQVGDNQTKLQNKTFSWGNRVVGHQTDRVVFGKPWHVREGALRNIRAAMVTESVQNFEQNRVDTITKPEYIVQDLTPLTKKEIEAIAKRQTIRDSSLESLI